MTTQELMEYFATQTDDIQQMIFCSTIWTDSIDEEHAQVIEHGLRILAENGNKQAAAMYCAILAYDHSDLPNCFCEKTAANMLFKMNALDEYRTITDKEFHEILNEDEFISTFYAFPARVLFSALIQLHEESNKADIIANNAEADDDDADGQE